MHSIKEAVQGAHMLSVILPEPAIARAYEVEAAWLTVGSMGFFFLQADGHVMSQVMGGRPKTQSQNGE